MKIYNSLTQTKENFVPIKDNFVMMYVCGITPYDTTHLGHAFTYIFYDVLLRYLKFNKYKVSYTQNVTDINDRDNDILQRAQEQKIRWDKLAEYWTDLFLNDMQTLNWISPTNYLWASEQIPHMITIVYKLRNHGLAYEKNGGVYLDIEKNHDFGKLSRLSKEEMLKIAKNFEEDIDNPDKRHPLDITLWRPTKPGQPKHIPSFESPFGKGRPGWHLECSAMAITSLGEQIDIHGGGIDLMYPHHESEIAQSEGATRKMPFAKYWIHTAYVSYKGEKMSKSLGNIVMIYELLKKYSPNAIRYVLISHHYREAWEFHEKELEEAEKTVGLVEEVIKKNDQKDEKSDEYENQFFSALNDDMNIPEALNVLTSVVKQNNNRQLLRKLFLLLGFT